ncbi:hypothetical protein P8452_19117 [Trifolium repens]|nr:hypothetical protein P8452_19117 [Trifolium repens]
MASHNVFLLHHSFFANTDVGHEKSSFLDDLLATLQTYQMEFDAQCKIGKPPRLTTRCGTEVEYPTHHPPLRYLLPKIESPLHVPSSNHTVSQNCFVRSFTKEVTFYDMYSGILISGGWTDYCTVHGVSHHDKLRFSVVVPQHNYELYVSFSTSVRGHS